MIGFGDAANKPPNNTDFGNDGVPACANAPNQFNPATFATKKVAGRADQSGVVPRTIVFPEQSAADGGQQTVAIPPCIIQFPPFLGNQLRSRVQFGSQRWPGKHLTAGGQLTGLPGAGGGTLSAGGGLAMASAAAQTTMFKQTFYQAAPKDGTVQITKGAANFGGGVPVNNNGAVQLGVNFPPFTGNLGVPLVTFGVKEYAEGFLPTGPSSFGTDMQNVDATGTRATGFAAAQTYNWRVHTPGPLTGGVCPGMGAGGCTTPGQVPLPLTANLGWSQGATKFAGGNGTLLTTEGDFSGLFFKWTTGTAKHTDMSGMWTTDRTASGHDWTAAQFAANATAAPNGTTRKLQLVTPWSASIKKRGTKPWAGLIAGLPDFGFGGLAVLTLDIQEVPVPEPGTLAMLGFGVTGLVGLGRLRRRK